MEAKKNSGAGAGAGDQYQKGQLLESVLFQAAEGRLGMGGKWERREMCCLCGEVLRLRGRF